MEFNAYIDESGDDGINTGGTDWFLIGAVVARKERDAELARGIDEVKALIEQRNPARVLHWQDFHRHHQKRLAIITRFAQLPFSLVVCGVHKPSLADPEAFAGKQRLYNYVTRHVLERVGWLVRDASNGDGFCNLFFENRASMSYEDLEAYLHRIKQEPNNRRSWAMLGPPLPRNKKDKKNLQVADCCVAACYAALEPHPKWGIPDPSYIPYLAERFYRRRGNLASYGLKLLPTDKKNWVREHPWLQHL